MSFTKQNIKEKSIAYFNSVNASIALLGNNTNEKEIRKWRNWFYQEWLDWYADAFFAKPIDKDKANNDWNEKKQEIYNANAQLDTIQLEEDNK